MQPVIKLSGVSKCYRIYNQPQDRFKQALLDRMPAWLRRNRNPYYREHWALRDVSFEIKPGEAVGILGRNGAGKSTLLQIIAGTLAPTSGDIETAGRITALLELGSGFNPEFTGRENVFHNAQILGLTRAETLNRFDDIAEFADIGSFIEQPVKTYSSGMMMRLAFAVQTVLDPAIMIVDEALSVGDARFQEKCFRRLKQLRDSGTSILFVTHDINSITSFCDRAMLFNNGSLTSVGLPESVIHRYLEVLYSDRRDQVELPKVANESAVTQPTLESADQQKAEQALAKASGRFGNRKVEIISVGIFNADGMFVDALVSGEQYCIKQRIRVNEDIPYLATGFIVRTAKSLDIFGVTNKSIGMDPFIALRAGQVVEVSIEIHAWLGAGDYILHVANAGEDGVQYDCIPSALQFTVISTDHIFSCSIVNLMPKFNIDLV